MAFGDTLLVTFKMSISNSENEYATVLPKLQDKFDDELDYDHIVK